MCVCVCVCVCVRGGGERGFNFKMLSFLDEGQALTPTGQKNFDCFHSQWWSSYCGPETLGDPIERDMQIKRHFRGTKQSLATGSQGFTALVECQSFSQSGER